MWRSLVVLGVFGIALGACDGLSPDGGTHPSHDGGAGASGEAGAPGGDAGEGGSSGEGGRGGDAGTSGGGAAARGGSENPGGEGGDAGAAGDGNGAGSGGGGNAGMGGAGGSAGANGGNGAAGAGGIAGGGTGAGGDGMGGAGTGGAGTGGGGTGGGGMGGRGPTCTAERCLEELGANPCGAWSCSTTGECVVETATCVDGDGDGLGVGTSCACNLDCDDNDAEVTSEKTIPCCRTGSGTKTCTNGVWQACTAGIPATAEACDGEDDDCDGTPDNGLGEFTCGMGVCRVSVPACVAGEVSACLPGPPTSSVDGCNELDDDCDGAVDEDCSSCVHVAPNGDDSAALSNQGLTPFRNVQTAIDFAAARPEVATRVCVAGGTSCDQTATYPGPSGTELTMRNGIDVLGGYESTTWTRCATTRLAPTTGLGVLFPESVQELTILDGFSIDRVGAATTAGVSVRGGRGVLLSNVRIEGGPAATVSYGVNVTAGGEATVFRSRVDGGLASREAVGVRSVGSRVFLEDNCGALAPERCVWTPALFAPPSQRASCSGAWIQGSRESEARVQIAVLLDGSPGSRIERSAVCGFADGSIDPSGVHVVGDAANVLVRANSIAIARYVEGDSAALRMNDCRGAAPWIVDNHSILNTGSSSEGTASGVRAFGDCHPVVDSNTSIVVRSSAYGVSSAITCGTPGGAANRCVIVNNARIATESVGAIAPNLSGKGVWCNGCVKVSRNSISGVEDWWGSNSCGMGCEIDSVGLSIASAEALIDRNRIYGGCALAGSTTGLAGSGNLRIQNNDIQAGRICGVTQILRGPFTLTALSLGSGVQDVHSNYIDGGNPGAIDPIDWSTPCAVIGAWFSGTGGIVRNNRILAGSCSGASTTPSSVAFREATAASDPSVFENNSLVSYMNEGTTSLSVTQINALTDMTTSGNIGSCASTGAVLVSGSTCIDAGTPIGAPLVDIDGDPRDGAPDIGPDEF